MENILYGIRSLFFPGVPITAARAQGCRSGNLEILFGFSMAVAAVALLVPAPIPVKRWIVILSVVLLVILWIGIFITALCSPGTNRIIVQVPSGHIGVIPMQSGVAVVPAGWRYVVLDSPLSTTKQTFLFPATCGWEYELMILGSMVRVTFAYHADTAGIVAMEYAVPVCGQWLGRDADMARVGAYLCDLLQDDISREYDKGWVDDPIALVLDKWSHKRGMYVAIEPMVQPPRPPILY